MADTPVWGSFHECQRAKARCELLGKEPPEGAFRLNSRSSRTMPGQDGSWKKGHYPEYAGGENVNRLGKPKGWPAVSPEFSIHQKGICYLWARVAKGHW